MIEVGSVGSEPPYWRIVRSSTGRRCDRAHIALAAEVQRLRAEVERLRADAARLNWIAAQYPQVYFENDDTGTLVETGVPGSYRRYHATSFRDAVDIARGTFDAARGGAHA